MFNTASLRGERSHIIAPVMNNLFAHRGAISREQRARLNGHGAAVVWFTGYSGAGKSTLAHALEARLHERGHRAYVLDGDNVRHGLCGDLGFSEHDRHENIRRVGEVAGLLVDAGMIAIAALISPYRADRERVRARVGAGDFLEVYCRCPLDVCEARDRKGIYRRARAGEIADFTGISAPYEPPLAADLVLDTSSTPLEECVSGLTALLRDRGIIG